VVDSLTGEEQAWAGIEAVLDDIESVATQDILPEAVIRSRSSSSSSKPATSFLRKGRPEDDDDSDIDSHDVDSISCAVDSFVPFKTRLDPKRGPGGNPHERIYWEYDRHDGEIAAGWT
jgi:hypothetical protein